MQVGQLHRSTYELDRHGAARHAGEATTGVGRAFRSPCVARCGWALSVPLTPMAEHAFDTGGIGPVERGDHMPRRGRAAVRSKCIVDIEVRARSRR